MIKLYGSCVSPILQKIGDLAADQKNSCGKILDINSKNFMINFYKKRQRAEGRRQKVRKYNENFSSEFKAQ